MAAPIVYRSDDASAPAISGTAGSLVAALTAILTAGYGAKAAAGWTAAYTGTNRAAYRQGSGHQYYLRVDDTAAQMARVVGYKAMTDVDTGTEPFPTDTQVAGGLYLRKSTTANSTSRPWICVATDRTFYLLVLSSSASFDAYSSGDAHIGFGQFASVTAGDANNAFLIASNDTSTTSTSASQARQCLGAVAQTAALATHYLAGGYSQAAGAVPAWKAASGVFAQSTYSGDLLTINFPDKCVGSLGLYRFGVMESKTAYRGALPGLLGCSQPYSTAVFAASRFTTLRGYGARSDLRLLSVNVSTQQFFIDLGDWDG